MKIINTIKSRWKQGIPLEDKLTGFLVFIYSFLLILIWVVPPLLGEIIKVYPLNIPILSIIGWTITLLAIVPTLTLMAAQLASGAYTYKILPLYRREPYLWMLIGLFVVVVSMGLLISILNIKDSRFILTFQSSAAIGILFLIPYFLNTLSTIGFESSIERLIGQIRREELVPLLFEDKSSLNPDYRDPSFAIRSILEKAIKDNDLQAFGFTLNRYTSAYTELIADLLANPIKYNPKLGFTQYDQLMGPESSEKFWTETAIRKLAEHLFQHAQGIQQTAFKEKNEAMLIELASALNRLSIDCGELLHSEDMNRIQDVIGEKVRYVLTTMAKEATDRNYLDVVAQCVEELGRHGSFGAEFNIRNVAFSAKKDLEEITENFVKGEWTRFKFGFILCRLLSAQRQILVNQITFQERDVSTSDFDTPINLSKILLYRGYGPLNCNIRANVEAILIPVLLQYYGKNSEEKLRQVSSTVHDIFPFNQETLLPVFQSTLLRYQNAGNKPSHYYQYCDPEKWLNSMIRNLDKLIHSVIESPVKGYPDEVLDIYEDLIILAYRMDDLELVHSLITKYTGSHILIKECGKESLITRPDNFLSTFCYSCLHKAKDNSATYTIKEMIRYGKTSPEIASRITYHLAYLGSYAICLRRKKVADEILKSLLELEIHFSGYKTRFGLGGVRTLSELSGFISTGSVTPRILSPYLDDLDRMPILYRLIGDSNIENPSKECAKMFMQKHVIDLLSLANYRAHLLKSNIGDVI